ncbi:MAG TPA: marine proteobacterial sortase target protein [Burkholderiales bacterium]|nr:marine proteobacterial sortase target protein [Burkholderiales bacterium]
MQPDSPVRHSRVVALDMLAFVGLAAAVALAAALVLVAAVLLLAGRAEAAQSEPGALLLRTVDGRELPKAPLLSTDVSFRVSGMVARARVVQVFQNASADWVEGVYVFPLPESAAVDRLRMQVGEREIEGEMHEREAARRTYQAARDGGRRAALMDQERPNIFTTRVANIGPQESIAVELEYQQTLRYDGGRYSLRFPMVVGPRYIPGFVRTSTPEPLGWSPNTDQVPDAARITPPVLRPEAGPVNPVSIRVALDAGVQIEEVSSTYHPVTVAAPSANRREIALAAGSTPANRDFELAWTLQRAQAPQLAWFTEEKAGRHYGVLMLLPPAPAPGVRLAREVVFVLDTSGSMAGASIRQAKDALQLALARLAPGDAFNVIEFNSAAQALHPRAVPVNPGNVRRAIDWVQALQARGGTEMASALALALDGSDEAGRVRQVVFLTDGAVGNEDALFRLVRARLGGTRLFTIGIGSAPNSHFMTKAAELGRGTFTYIGRIDEVQEKMAALFAKLESPVLKGLEVLWPEGVHAESWPARLPDLYAGEPVVVAAALQRLEGSVRVRGTREGRLWEAQVPLAHSVGNAGMGSLWARGKVEGLMDSIREGAAEDKVRAEVIDLALAHRLVTKYTSFVAVDKTPARVSDAQLKLAAVPTNLPEGWEYDKVFGELPQGATDSRFAMLSGALLLLLALAMLRWRTA